MASLELVSVQEDCEVDVCKRGMDGDEVVVDVSAVKLVKFPATSPGQTVAKVVMIRNKM